MARVAPLEWEPEMLNPGVEVRHKRATQHFMDETSIPNGHLAAHLNEDQNQDAHAHAHVHEAAHFHKRSANPQLTIGADDQKNMQA